VRAANRGGARHGTVRLTDEAGQRQGPVAAVGVRVEVRASRAAQRGALTGGPGSTVPPGSVLNRIKNIPNGSNGFKILELLTDSKGAFCCCKNCK
jgi:hypothetical protein